MNTIINSFQHAIWNISRFLYKYTFSLLLSFLSMDKIHTLSIKTNRLLGNISIIRNASLSLFKNRNNKCLEQNYYGINFKTPIGLAAGYDKSGEVIPMISTLGFGFSTIGSVTANKCAGNPRPWFYRLQKTRSIVVNAGLNNDGSSAIINRLNKYSQKIIKDFPVIISVAKTNSSKVIDTESGINDYISTIKLAKNEPAIKIIELNISCPNTYGGEPFTDPERLKLLLKTINRIGVKKPIFIKMPVDLEWDLFKKLLTIIIENKISGVIISNLTKDRSEIEPSDNIANNIKGSLSGRPTWNQSNELLRRTYLNYGNKLTIIGAGGIFTAEDAYKKIKLGASLIELVTGLMLYGPQLPSEINDELIKLIHKDGYNNISQAIGVDCKS